MAHLHKYLLSFNKLVELFKLKVFVKAFHTFPKFETNPVQVFHIFFRKRLLKAFGSNCTRLCLLFERL